MLHIDMYTDGSCLNNSIGPGGYGVIVRYLKKGKFYEKHMASGYQDTTNNRMELIAAIKGFELINKQATVTVYSDSMYLVNAFQKNWIQSWEAINWDRGDNGGVIKNTDLWKELLRKMNAHRVNYVWVKGHNGHSFNEVCDKLAVQAAKNQESYYIEGYAQNLNKEVNKNCISYQKEEYAKDTLLNLFSKTSEFIIIPWGSYDASNKTGKSKILLKYGSQYKVIIHDTKCCKSVSDVMLEGILKAIKSIRLSRKNIIIVSGIILGFENYKKSSNTILVKSIVKSAKLQNNRIEVIFLIKGMKPLKKIIDTYDCLSEEIQI